ncbi:MAG TPA: hypothetical protein VMT79_18945 [Candidatus Binatia bacterium]|nr:hypothetical protein [Candidatus Binatia bacterium]
MSLPAEAGTQPGTLTVTLRTPDGFGVSWALPAADLMRMATIGARACEVASAVIGH